MVKFFEKSVINVEIRITWNIWC